MRFPPAGYGEFLLALALPPLSIAQAVSTGGSAAFSIAVPANPGLVGLTISIQAIHVPARSSTDVPLRHPSCRLSAMGMPASARGSSNARKAERCRQKFLRTFPGGFRDETYLAWERDYKWETHVRWEEALGRAELRRLLRAHEFAEIAARAVRVEQSARHPLVFSFEKMALRDAVRSPAGARAFAEGLDELLHGRAGLERRFERWIGVVASLPRRQTRVLTWPLVTVFGFLAQPDAHVFLKPNTTRAAARAYGFDLRYRSRPTWETYASLLELAAVVRRDLRDLRPRDMIDVQSFLWVQGSEEYR